ncbi:NAD-dependent epimerase/dehydratase family protein [Lentzea nigeriaca]|uniref:NAD-dependent epimerase/dehydratase family protein n=1 Tax=Lentzea nigeriaca TaxID=1128665 RepID=UPI00195970F4|nr:NAD(P)-dependent oxidoreductase [Lentzea nigeriaca]MBM7862198.1 dTDP-6-deoxy-L-talose 4-dehydrogenase [NAD(P)+] [Lentzea nigeriaca]
MGPLGRPRGGLTMPDVIVLGGTGFVGRHVCDAFTAAGHEVLAVARKPPPAPRFRALDLSGTSAEALAEVLGSCAAVVDATGSSWGLSEEDMATRCLALSENLQAALALLPVRPRLVHLGSVLEYGPIPHGESAGRSTPELPDTSYGVAKLAAARLVVSSGGVVLRVANAVGPGLPATSLLGQVASALLAGRDVELAPLSAFRDYVDVRDVAAAAVAAAHSEVSGEIIGIGRGEAVAVRSLVDLLIEVSGVPAHVVERDIDTGWRAKSSWLQVDPTPALDLLGWRPRHSLRDAVTAFWKSCS